MISYAAALVLLGGCAHHEVEPTPAPASQLEKNAALTSYMNCLAPYAKRLDDGKSDARTIAQAMRGACPGEMESVIETISRGENNRVKMMMRQQFGSVEESTALKVVLDVRHAEQNPRM
jgi:hypothetical protein